MEILSFTIASKDLGISLTKGQKDIYNENFTSMKKETEEEDTR